MTQTAIYECPLCEQPMLAVGFCHLVCPTGHYQEVCSDLFVPDRIADESSKPVKLLSIQWHDEATQTQHES